MFFMFGICGLVDRDDQAGVGVVSIQPEVASTRSNASGLARTFAKPSGTAPNSWTLTLTPRSFSYSATHGLSW